MFRLKKRITRLQCVRCTSSIANTSHRFEDTVSDRDPRTSELCSEVLTVYMPSLRVCSKSDVGLCYGAVTPKAIPRGARIQCERSLGCYVVVCVTCWLHCNMLHSVRQRPYTSNERTFCSTPWQAVSSTMLRWFYTSLAFYSLCLLLHLFFISCSPYVKLCVR